MRYIFLFSFSQSVGGPFLTHRKAGGQLSPSSALRLAIVHFQHGTTFGGRLQNQSGVLSNRRPNSDSAKLPAVIYSAGLENEGYNNRY